MNILIDGSSLLWRSHYATSNDKNNGEYATCYKFLNNVKSFSNMYNTKNIYIAWDKKLNREKNFRQTSTDGQYKGQRDKSLVKDVYHSQPLIHKASELLGCKNIYPWIMEADDIIAWLSKNLDGENLIITTDGDMLQLINNKTYVYNPQKKHTIDLNNFEQILGLPIEHYLPYKAIMGDTSDNINGLTGYGPVKSKILAKKWVESNEEVKEEYRVIIENNLKLMDLSVGYIDDDGKEVDVYKSQLNIYKKLEPNFDEFSKLCEKYKLKSITDNMNDWKNTFEINKLAKLFNNMDF